MTNFSVSREWTEGSITRSPSTLKNSSSLNRAMLCLREIMDATHMVQFMATCGTAHQFCMCAVKQIRPGSFLTLTGLLSWDPSKLRISKDIYNNLNTGLLFVHLFQCSYSYDHLPFSLIGS